MTIPFYLIFLILIDKIKLFPIFTKLIFHLIKIVIYYVKILNDFHLYNTLMNLHFQILKFIYLIIYIFISLFIFL